MKHLPNDLLEELKKKLEEERRNFQAKRDSIAEQDPFRDEDRINDNAASDTDANEESSHDRIAAITESLDATIVAITTAQQKMEDGTYGICESCGNQIPENRLLILPYAHLCMTCENEGKNR